MIKTHVFKSLVALVTHMKHYISVGQVNTHRLLEDIGRRSGDRYPLLWGTRDEPTTEFSQVTARIMQKYVNVR